MSSRVLFVAPSAYTLSGLATWMDYLLPGLVDLNWDVTLGLVSGPRYHRPDCYLAEHPFANVVPIHSSCGTRTGRIAAVRKAIHRVRPQIVLSVNIPDAMCAAAIERDRCDLANPRIVMTCHEIEEYLFADMRRLRKVIDAVVCTNRLACKLARELGGIDPRRVHHAACGAAIPRTIPNAPENAVLTIAYVGRLEQAKKRILDVVDVAAGLAEAGVNFVFLTAGSGSDELRFRLALEKRNLTRYFRFLGFVPADQLNKRVYGKADAVLVTSSSETGPIVIWEAMAAGTPVVTSRYIGSGREQLLWNNQNCLMFDIGDSKQAANCLVKLQNDRALRDSIRANAFETATQELSHNVSVKCWDGLMRQVLQQPRMQRHAFIPSKQSSVGRLDTILGTRNARTVRRLLRRLPPDTGPGGEWPHKCAGPPLTEDNDFWTLAREFDQRDGVDDGCFKTGVQRSA